MNKLTKILMAFSLIIGLYNSEFYKTYAETNDELTEEVNNEENLESDDNQDLEIEDNYVKPDVDYTGINMEGYNNLSEVQQRALDMILAEENKEPELPRTKALDVLTTGLKIFSDGTPTWTTGSGLAGNDNGPSNKIVRSFDVITYRVDFGFNDTTPATIVIEGTIPQVAGQESYFSWDTDIMTLLGYRTELSGANNETIKVFYDNVNPGFGVSTKLPLKVNDAINGTTITPTVKVYKDGETAIASNTMQPDVATVSATAKLNLSLVRDSIVGLGTFDYGGYKWGKFFIPTEVQLIGTPGGKGMELTAGNLSYAVNWSGKYTNSTTDSSGLNNTTYRVLDYGVIGEVGLNGEYIGFATDTGSRSGNYDYMGKSSLSINDAYTVYNSGIVTGDGTIGMGTYKSGIRLTFSGYEHNQWNNRTYRGQLGNTPFATGGVIVAVRGKTSAYSNYNIKISASISDVVATSMSGQSLNGQNSTTVDDSRSGIQYVRTGTESIFPIQDGSVRYSGQGQAAHYIDQRFHVGSYHSRSTNLPNPRSITHVLHFDPRAYKAEEELYLYGEGVLQSGFSYALRGSFSHATKDRWYPADRTSQRSMWYGVSATYNDSTLSKRKLGDGTLGDPGGITWYSSYSDAMAQVTDPTGLTGPQICAIKTEFPAIEAGVKDSTYNISNNFFFSIKDNSVTRAARGKGTTFQINEYVISYYRDDKSIASSSYYSQLGGGSGYPLYVKKQYNDNGTVKTEGTHTQPGPGNVTRILDYDVRVSKKSYNEDGTDLSTGNTVIPKIDNRVKWEISPQTFGGNLSIPGGGPIKITDTVPKGLEVDETTISPTPVSVTKNIDGTTTIYWELHGYNLSQEIEPLTYVTEVDKLALDGATYTNNVSVTVGDKTVNADSTITVLDDAVFSVQKEVDNKRIEMDGNFEYTLRLMNKSSAPEDLKVYDIFPHMGDNAMNTGAAPRRGTNYSGTYQFETLSSTIPNSTVYYSYDTNLMYAVVESATFKTEAEWNLDPLGFDRSKVTAVKIEALQVPVGVEYNAKFGFSTEGNVVRDKYSNHFVLVFKSVNNGQIVDIPVLSNVVHTEVIDREVSGTAWIDFNQDGLRNLGEPLLSNVPVKLFYKDENGNYVPFVDRDGNQVETTTNASGDYKFTGLPPHVYAVGFDLENYGGDPRTLTTLDVNSNNNDDIDNDATFEVMTWDEETTCTTPGVGDCSAEGTTTETVSKNLAMIKEIDATPVPPVGTYTGVYPNNDAGIKALYKVEMTKTANATTATPGQTIEYTFEIKNSGEDILNNVTLTDLFDDVNFVVGSSAFVSVVDSNGVALNSSRYTTTDTRIVINSMPAGEVVYATFEVEVKSVKNIDDTKTSIVNTASVTSDEAPGNTDSVDLPLNAPDMEIDKYLTDSAVTEAKPGDTVYYTVKVTNTGNMTLNNVVVNDPFSDPNFASSMFIEVLDSTLSPLATGFNNTDTVVTIDSLAVGEVIYVKYSAVVKDTADIDDSLTILNNKVTVKSDETDDKTDEVDLPLKAADIAIDKYLTDSTVTEVNPGDVVYYTVKVENTGNIVVNNVLVSDPFDDPNFASAEFVNVKDSADAVYTTGVGNTGTDVTITQLAVGQVLYVNYKAVVATTKDIDDTLTLLSNEVTVTTDDTDDKTDKVDVPLKSPDMEMDKYLTDGVTSVAPEDTVLYSVKVTNTGNEELTNVVVSDPFNDSNFEAGTARYLNTTDGAGTVISTGVNATGTTVTIDSLAVGESVIVNYSVKVVSQANVDTTKDVIENTATATSDKTPDITDKEQVDLKAPDMEIDKSTPSTSTAPGQIIEYSVKVMNTGNIPLTGVIVNDPFDDPNIASASYNRVTDANGALITTGVAYTGTVVTINTIPVGEFVTVYYTATVKEAGDLDIFRDNIENTVKVSSNETGDKEDEDIVLLPFDAPSMEINKSTTSTVAYPEDTIPYVIEIKNTGNRDLTNVVVNDPFDDPNFGTATFVKVEDSANVQLSTGFSASGTVVTIDRLEVGETVYVYYNADVKTLGNIDTSRADLINVVKVKSDQTDEETDNVTLPLVATDLYMNKSTTFTEAKPGDVIPYTVTVKNVGNVALTNVVVSDPFDDVNFAGAVYVKVTDSNGNDYNVGISDAGTVVTIATLQVGQELTVHYTATVKAQNDIDDSKTKLINTATATSDQTGEIKDKVELPLKAPELTLTKDITDSSITELKPGDTAPYTIVVTNSGNTTLTNVVIEDLLDDPNFEHGSGQILSVVDGNGVSLEGQYTVVGSALHFNRMEVGAVIKIMYQVTVQNIDDIDTSRDTIVNTASADSKETDKVIDNETLPFNAPDITIDKYLTDSTVTEVKPGDTVLYTVKVENTGNKVLNNVLVSDPFNDPNFASSAFINVKDSADAVYTTGVGNTGTNVTITQLAVGQVLYVNYSAVVKATDDIDDTLTVLNNKVTVSTDDTDDEIDEVEVPLKSPDLTMDKYLTDSTVTEAKPGDTVLYTVKVENTGNITLNNVLVSDPFDDVNFAIASFVNITDTNDTVYTTGVTTSGANVTISQLAVGQVLYVNYKVTVKATDNIDDTLTVLKNKATVKSDETDEEIDEVELPLKAPDITIDKYLTDSTVTEVKPGDTVLYTVKIENTGNVVLNNVLVSDPFNDSNFASSAFINVKDSADALYTTGVGNTGTDVTITQLAVGQVLYVNYSAVVKATDDIDDTLTVLNNKVTVSTDDTDDEIDEVEVPLKSPDLTMDKYLTDSTVTEAKPGDTVLYTVKVENTGNITLNNVVVSDPFNDPNFASSNLISITDENELVYTTGVTNSGTVVTISQLAVGQVLYVNYSAVVKATDDINDTLTVLNNKATVKSDETDEEIDEVELPLKSPDITIDKYLTDSTVTEVKPGDTVLYTVKIENTGNVVLNNVVVSDPFNDPNFSSSNYVDVRDSSDVVYTTGVGNSATDVTITQLAVGQVLYVNYSAVVKATDDIDDTLTVLNNKVTVSTDDTDDEIDEVEVPLKSPDLTMDKYLTDSTVTEAKPGDTVLYTVKIENTGNITLNNVVVSDPFDDVNFAIASFVNITDSNDAVYTTGVTTSGTNVTISQLAVGQVLYVNYMVTVKTTDNIDDTLTILKNKATVKSDETDEEIDEVELPLKAPDITIDKYLTDSTVTEVKPGDTVLYTVKIENTGNVVLNNVLVSDPFNDPNFASSSYVDVRDSADAVYTTGVGNTGTDVNITQLAVGQVLYVNYSAVVKATDDIDDTLTVINNKVTVSTDDTDDEIDEVEVPLKSPDITIDKYLTDSTVTKVGPGDTVLYTVKIENTGNVVLNNVVVSDPFNDPNFANSSFVGVKDATDALYTTGVGNSGTDVTINQLAVGQVLYVNYSAVVKASEDVDNSVTVLNNKVTVSTDDTDDEIDEVDVPLDNPDITIDKYLTDSTVTEAEPGDTVLYTVKVENTGNKVLNNVLVSDPFNDPNFASSTFIDVKDSSDAVYTTGVGNTGTDVTITQLAIGQVLYVNYSAVVKAIDDIDDTLTVLHNKVTVSTDETDDEIDEVDLPLKGPDMEIDKELKDSTITEVKPGDVIEYRVKVENTGNVALNNVVVNDPFDDPNFDVSSFVSVTDVVDVAYTTGVSNNDTVVTISKLEVGQVLYVNYVTTVKATDDIDDTLTVLRNKVTVSSDETDDKTDEVEVPLKSPDITIDKYLTDSTVTEVKPGDTVLYTVKIENTGNVVLNNVLVSDPFNDPNFASSSYVDVRDSADAVYTTGVSNSGTDVTITQLAVGQVLYVNYSAVVKATDDVDDTLTVLNNKVTVSTDDTDDEIDEVEVPLKSPDITIDKYTTTTEVRPEDEITYFVKVTNTGNIPLTNVVVNDPFNDPNFDSSEFKVVLDENDAEYNTGVSNNGTVVTIDNLAVGQVLYVKYVAKVKSTKDIDDTLTVLNNKVTVSTNETDDEIDEVDIPLKSPDIEIEKSTAIIKAEHGFVIPYKVAVTNTGNIPLTNVVIDDPFDDVDFELGTIRFLKVTDSGDVELVTGVNNRDTVVTVDSLAVGETIYVYFAAKVKSIADISNKTKITNVVKVVTDETDELTSTVNLPIDTYGLVIDKSTTATTAEQGQEIPYVVKVENTGDAVLTNVVIDDPFDDVNFESSNFVNVTDASGNVIATGVSNNGTVVTYNTLAIGEVIYVNYTAKVKPLEGLDKSKDKLINTVSVTTDQLPKVIDKVEIPLGSYGVRLTKSVNVTSVNPGDAIVYTLKAENIGTMPLQDVVVIDEFSDPSFDKTSIRVVSVLDGNGNTLDASRYEVTGNKVKIKELAADETVYINMSVNVLKDVDGAKVKVVENTATITTDKTKTKPSNKVTVPVNKLPVTGIDYGMMYVLLIGLMLILITRLVIKKNK